MPNGKGVAEGQLGGFGIHGGTSLIYPESLFFQDFLTNLPMSHPRGMIETRAAWRTFLFPFGALGGKTPVRSRAAEAVVL